MNTHAGTNDQPANGEASGADNIALMTSVARLYYLERLGQSEIASIYGVSRSTISRMLTTARDLGIVHITVDEYDSRDRELERKLVDRFGLHQAIVVRGMEGTEVAVRGSVGYFAAPIVDEWIAASRRVGLAGGRTLGELLRAIKHRSKPHDLEVVQLMGTIGSSPSNIDASELSRALASRFHGKFHNINAPAFVKDRQTRDLFLSHSQIQSVRALFPTLDVAFVGIGTLEESVFVEREVLTKAEFLEIGHRGAVGEICGRFFDSSGRECDSPFRDRVVSIDLDVLRAGKEVVAVTTGAARSNAVRAALNGGLVQSLVIDDVGARGVLEGR